MEALTAQQVDQELFNLQAELADCERSILAALEANVTEQYQNHPYLLRLEQFLAFCHAALQKSETVLANMRFEIRSQKRYLALCRTLAEQKREAVGSDALRVHVESVELERLAGERELGSALATDRELRMLVASMKRATLQDQEALFDATQQLIRAQQTVDSELALLQDYQTRIEQTERRVAQLEQTNERLRQDLHGLREATLERKH